MTAKTNQPDQRRRQLLASASALAASAILPSAAWAGGAAPVFPVRPVRMIVPMPPGGATDGMARLIAIKLGERWGQSVVVENRGGGGSIIGSQAVATAAPDGYTFGMVISAHTINPSLRKDLPYDTLKDFAAVSELGYSPMALVAYPGFPADDVSGLIAAAKAKPGAIEYASLGVGTATHLFGEMLKLRAGIDLVHVPYNGSTPAYNDLLPGRVPVGVVVLESALPHIKAGKLKLLAITSAKRSAAHPDFPTVTETVPGAELDSIMGFVAPGRTPPAIVQKLADGLVAVLRDPEVNRQLVGWGVEVVGSPPREFDAFIRSQIESSAQVIKAANLSIDK